MTNHTAPKNTTASRPSRSGSPNSTSRSVSSRSKASTAKPVIAAATTTASSVRRRRVRAAPWRQMVAASRQALPAVMLRAAPRPNPVSLMVTAR